VLPTELVPGPDLPDDKRSDQSELYYRVSVEWQSRRNMGIRNMFFSTARGSREKIRFGERMSLDLVGEFSNLFNRFNEAAADPFLTRPSILFMNEAVTDGI